MAQAQSNSSTLWTNAKVHEFGCAWPNKWKAGSSRIYAKNPFTFPTVIVTSTLTPAYEMGSDFKATSFEWNYTDNNVMLSGLSGELYKFTPDMVNDYCTIVVSIGKVIGTDANGDDVETELYRFSATIIGEELVINDPTGTFTSNDFILSAFNGGVRFTLNTSTKTLPLSIDVSEEDEINLSFYSDCDNLEDGTGKTGLTAVSLREIEKKLYTTQNVIFNLYGNPTRNEVSFSIAIVDLPTNYNGRLRVEDITGKLVKEFEILFSNSVQIYTISTDELPMGVYYMTFKYEGKQYGHKLVIDKN